MIKSLICKLFTYLYRLLGGYMTKRRIINERNND